MRTLTAGGRPLPVAPPDGLPPARPGVAVAAVIRRLTAVVLRHRVFSVLLLAGLAIRVVVQLAYQPALVYPDSVEYLTRAHDLTLSPVHPFGYSLLILLLRPFGTLAAIPAVQHLLGLTIAVLVYRLLLRFRLPKWVAALATVPVLFDAWQLSVEQFVLSDVLYQFLIVVTFTLLLWRPVLTVRRAVAVGLLLAAAALTRLDGLVLLAPALCFVLWRARPLLRPREESAQGHRLLRWAGRIRLRRLTAAGALLAAVVVPLAGYSGWFDHSYGVFAVTDFDGFWLYGRVAQFADCAHDSIPADQQFLCPRQPPADRPIADWWVWSRSSPVVSVPAHSRDPNGFLRSFDLRVIAGQPVDYAGSVLTDLWHSFAPTRASRPGDPVSENVLRFSTGYPIAQTEEPWPVPPAQLTATYGGGPLRVNRVLTGFLHGYQGVMNTPGTLIGLLIVAGCAGAVFGVPGSRLRAPAVLLSVSALLAMTAAFATTTFSWRYQLPALPLAPVAGALGVRALLDRRRPPVEPSAPAEPVQSSAGPVTGG